MALANTVTVAKVTAQCPELATVCTEAHLLQDIANAYEWLKAELNLKYSDKLERELDEEFNPAKIPDDKNPLYMRIVISRARYFAFDRISTQALTGSHAYHRDFYHAESEDLIRRTELWYDYDESGTVEDDERIQVGTELIR